MNLSDLIKHVGDENVKVQNLFGSVKQAKTKLDGQTTITFVTSGITTNDLVFEPKETVAFVLFIPVAKLPEEYRNKICPSIKQTNTTKHQG